MTLLLKQYWMFGLAIVLVAAYIIYKEGKRSGRKSGYTKCRKEVNK